MSKKIKLARWVKSLRTKRGKTSKKTTRRHLKVMEQRFQIIFLGYRDGLEEITRNEVFGLLDKKKRDFLRGTFDKDHVMAFSNYLNAHPEESTRFQYAKEN